MTLLGRMALIAALIAAPWPFGSVTPQAQWMLGVVIAALVVWQLIESLVHSPESACHLPTAVVAPIGLLVIAAIQLLPRDEPLILRMQHAVLADLSGSFADGVQTTGTVSPAATRAQTSLLFFALAAFLLSSRWFAAGSSQLWLWRALAFNGAALGFFGIVQKLSWNGMLFWSVPLRHGGTPFASYVNRNNAAGYLVLCLGAGLAWMIAELGSRRSDLPSDRRTHGSRLPWKVRMLRQIAQVNGLELCLLATVVLVSAAVLYSLSRGGIVGLLAGLAIVLCWQRWRARLAGLAMLLLLAGGAAGTLAWVGGWGDFRERMNSLATPLSAAEGRVRHWQDTSASVRDFPVLGSGFGAYRYANLPYQRHEGAAWYMNADNHPFELLVETGLAGLSLYLSGFLLTAIAAVSLARRRAPQQRAAGLLGLFIVTAQLVQALTDFGLAIPANGLTFAVLSGSICGAACAAAEFDRIGTSLWLTLVRLESRWSLAAVSLLLAAASLAFGAELFVSTRAAAARNVIVEIDPWKPLNSRPDEFDDLIDRAQQALRLRPDDPELHRSIALWWINRYRLTAAHELRKTADPAIKLSGRDLWQLASTHTLSCRAATLNRHGERGQFERLRRLPIVRENLLPARRHLLVAARQGPLTRDVAKHLAELWFLNDEAGDVSSLVGAPLSKALFVSPSAPRELLAAALLAEAAGNQPLADRAYSRRLSMADDGIVPVWSLLSQSRPIEELIDQVVPDRLDVLVDLAEHSEDELIKSTLAIRADRLLNDGNWEDPEEPSELLRARLFELLGQTDEAVRHYRLALSAGPLEIETRLRLARLLLSEGRNREAEVELTLVQGLAPGRTDVKRRLEELKSKPVTEVPDRGN